MPGISPLLLQKWSSDKQKDLLPHSLWAQLSNRTTATSLVPGAEERKIPKDVVHVVSKKHAVGDWSTTVPLIEGAKADGVGGSMVAKGTGEYLDALHSKIYYNNVRKVIAKPTQGVEFNSVEYLSLGKEAGNAALDFLQMDNDYSCQRAIIDGADRYLTEVKYWDRNTEVRTPPKARVLNQNIAYRGMTEATMPVRHDTYDTDIANLATAAANMTVDSAFTLAALDRAIFFASGHVTPLMWNAGGRKIAWIILISRFQADQLRADQKWIDLMKEAEARGPENRALSGILGVRGAALVLEDWYSPIFHLSAAETGSVGFEYVVPANAGIISPMSGIASLNRVKKGAATVKTGTCEVARILGAGAIGVPCPKKPSLIDQTEDFGFQVEVCAHQMIGHQRMDFVDAGGTRKKNIGSALYLTATPEITL